MSYLTAAELDICAQVRAMCACNQLRRASRGITQLYEGALAYHNVGGSPDERKRLANRLFEIEKKALHDAIAQTHELAGTHGVFNFKPNEPYGLDKRSAVVIELEKAHWKLAQ